MGKSKQTKTGYDRPVKVEADGACLWQVGPWHWSYLCLPGINLTLLTDNGHHPITYCKDLKEAGIFAEGFHAGAHAAARLAAQKLPDPSAASQAAENP